MANFEYLQEQISKHNKEILFTHQTLSMLNSNSLDSILNNCLSIFIVREPKDALISWYFMNDPIPEINEDERINRIRNFIWSPFLNSANRIILWKEQINGYKKYHGQGLVIRYENLIQNYQVESQKIADYLSLSVSPTLPPIKSVELSRKGVVNDHRSYFDQKLIRQIDDICKEEIEYINTFLI